VEESLASGGVTGLLTMMLIAVLRFWDSQQTKRALAAEKANGGTIHDNLKDNSKHISVIEEKVHRMETDVNELKKKMNENHRDLCEFREEFREFLAYQRGKEHGQRDRQN